MATSKSGDGSEVLSPPLQSGTNLLLRLWRTWDIALPGAIFFAFILLASLLASSIAPRDPGQRDIKNRLKAPSIEYPFGTDEIGRDVFSRVLHGGRSVLGTGFLALALSFFFGLAIGIPGAYLGGSVDVLLMRCMDIMLSFPSILLAILVVTTLGTGPGNLVIAVGVAQVPVFARLARAVVLLLMSQEYVVAARALGARDPAIVQRHILPNMLPPVLVHASAMLAVTISSATALNFLGLGVETGTPDWGMMIADGQSLLFDAAHVPFFPGLCLTLTVLSVNFIGDGLRDRLDPYMRNQSR